MYVFKNIALSIIKSVIFMKNRTGISFRGAFCFFMILTLLLVGTLRIITVAKDERYYNAAAKQNTYSLKIGYNRGTIFDTNMQPLTNGEKKTLTAVAPTEEAIKTISVYLTSDELSDLKERLKDGLPVVIETEKQLKGEGILSATVTVNQNDKCIAEHLIGYTDGSGHGVSGLQKAYDEILYSDSSPEFRYVQNSLGGIVDDFSAEFISAGEVKNSGIKLCIDIKIQREVEKTADKLKSGAIVVSEVGTGKIRALASRPGYDVTNVQDYLTDDASPLINRAFCAYNVGSVFKPCVAAAALESETYASMLYRCEGNKTISGKAFACHKTSGHGVMNINDALTFSCNTYFYTLSEKLGSSEIYKMCDSLNFGRRYCFAPSLFSESGFLPTPSDIGKSLQSLANLAIGQGELMLTPVSLLTLYEAIANKGVYYTPQIVESVIKNGTGENVYNATPTRTFSEKTAETLKAALVSVVKNGTGKAASPTLCSAAGKTATAQTGWKDNGKAVDHSWFCGFFPADNPRYVVVIVSENTSGDGTPPAPLFSSLADSIYNLNLS